MTDIQEVYSNDIVDAIGTEGKASSGSKKLIARMPTERHAVEYNMKHKNRGHALIFSHETFTDKSIEDRPGTEEDCKRLFTSFEKLQFNVQVHRDKNWEDITKIVKYFASLDHTDNDCIAVAILSHGEHGYIHAKDDSYKLEAVTHYFTAENCKTLAGKPKLFFIQACRGGQLDSGVTLGNTETDGVGEPSTGYTIPIHADFLIAYSTIPGFQSFRNNKRGSWFIQSLCYELDENGSKYDILTLLTFVCYQVAVNFESDNSKNPIIHKKKQIPCTTTMLTRILRFPNKN